MAGDMELGKMKIVVGLDGKGVTDGVNKLERDIKGGVKNFSAFSSATRRGGQELEITKAKIGILGNSIQNMEKITGQYNKVLNDSTQMSKLTAGEQARLRQEYDQNSVKLNAYKQQFVDASREMAEMQVKTTGWTGALNSAGEKLTSVGSSMTKGITVPMAAVGAMALKVGFDFEEGMSRVKAISGASGAEMEKLTAQARQLGKDTAFSARETAQGMENLAMAGFSVNEIMQATPGLLDLAAVSGKDVGLAAEISAGTLRSFGLEASEAGRVADVLAKTATSAATDTSDLGEAMKYIAPVAHQLGMSVEETSAAIGVMANHSIKGSQAGTTMRMALTRMAKPTGEAQDAMEELGITYFDAQGKMKPFGTILGDLQKSMKGLSDEQRAATLKTLFGQTALSGMMAMVGEAPGKYDEFTESLNNSAGAADEMARTMQDNANNSIEQMMGSLEDAGIAIAKIVTPAFRDITKFIEQCADAFSDLDPEAQKIIVKLGLLAMAAGPTAFILGKVTTSAVSMAAAFKGMQAAKGAATAIGVLGTSATSASSGLGMLAGGAANGIKVFGALNPATLGVIGVIAGLGVAIGGVKWLEGQAHAKRWGDGVSESAGKALDSVKNAQGNVNVAFATTTGDGKLASKEVGKAFSDMNDEVQKNITDANKKISEGFSLLPKDLQDSLNKAKKAFENKNKDIADESKKISETIKNIEQQSGKETLEQQQYIHQSRLRMNELSVKSLGLNAEQEKEALRNLNASVTDMTSEQRRESVKGLADLASKTVESYDKQRATVKDFYDKGMLSSDEYKASISELDDLQDKANESSIARAYELMKANGENENVMRMQFAKMGTTLEDAQKAYDKVGDSAKKNMSAVISATSDADSKTTEAVNNWNSVVLDEKTGKLKTNAVEEVEKAMESEDGWNSMKLATKEANVGSNARQIFTEAAIDAGKWNSMSLKEKKATVNSNVASQMLDDKKAMDEFNKQPDTVKKVIMSSNSGETIQKSLKDMGVWDKMTPQIKKLVAESNAPIVAKGATDSIKDWNNLPENIKKLLTEDHASGKINEAIKTQKEWDALPEQVKKLLGDNVNVMQALESAGIKLGEYEAKTPQEKLLTANAANAVQAADVGKDAMEGFNQKVVPGKNITAVDKTADGVSAAQKTLGGLGSEKVVTIMAHFEEQRRATGDPNFMGGPVMINDQKGSNYRELVRLPSGNEYMPAGRNVRTVLPKGTRIFKASETNAIMSQRRDVANLESNTQVGTVSANGTSDNGVANAIGQLNRTSGAGMSSIDRTAKLILQAMSKQSGRDLFSSNSYEDMARDERNRNAQTL